MRRLLHLLANKERGEHSNHRVEACRIRIKIKIAINLIGDLVRRRVDQEVDKTWEEHKVAQYFARSRRTISRARRSKEVTNSGLQNNYEKAAMSLPGKRSGGL
jgi:ribosomal protein L14E/L6E/L27E